jgi:hypothetical protein
MAYKTKELFEKAIEAIKERKLFWIEQVVVYLPCVKSVFYDHFPNDSNESNALKTLLEDNRIKVCQAQNNKWFNSEQGALQIAFRKIVGTDEERRKLSQTYQDVNIGGKKEEPIKLSVDQIHKILDNL